MRSGDLTEIKSASHGWVHKLGGVIIWLAISGTISLPVIASLAPKFAAEIRDLILTPPVETPYDVLKETLIKRTQVSDQRRLQQLFSTEELGDRKPTQLRTSSFATTGW